MKSAIEAVERLERDLASLDAQWFDALDILVPFIRKDTIDAMYAAMSPDLRQYFLRHARLQFPAFDAIIPERIATKNDATGWIALRDWLYRQPFHVDPSLPFPSGEEVRTLGIIPTFERILPHLLTRSVDEVLTELPPAWRKQNLPELVAGMRPGIDVILATCRAHGQDPTPFVKLMEWEASLANKT
jgi:hypothetical protein